MDFSCNSHVHISPYSMEEIPSNEKNSPYISKKNVESLLDLNCKVKIDEEIISCSHLASLFTLKSTNCYRNNEKMRIGKLFADENSVKRAIPENFRKIYKDMIENSCGRHIIACDGFGKFLHGIASSTASGEQRFFILESCSHVMSFRITHKTRKMGESSIDKTDSWVVHFFDPNATNVVSRSEVLKCEEFLDPSRFSLRMFIYKNNYRGYFEKKESELIENECAIYEQSAIENKNKSFCFSTLETLSQDGISGCMIYHMMYSNISTLDIRGVLKSKLFSTLGADIRREVFLAKSSSGISVLQLMMEQNKPNSIISYNDLLEELSCDEQVNLLPEILHAKSSLCAPPLFMAMQFGYAECVYNFGLLLGRLINIRHRIPIDNLSEILFNILLAKRKDNLSALSMSVLRNKFNAILAFGSLLDNIFMLKDVMDARRIANMIFFLLDHRSKRGYSALFYAVKGDCADEVRALGALIDRLLTMKGCIPNDDMASMIFRLLESESKGMSALFIALFCGSSNAMVAFYELMDRLFIMKGSIPDNDMADMIFKLLIHKPKIYSSGLLIALEKGHIDTVVAFSGLIGRVVVFLKESVSTPKFDYMMLEILMIRERDGTSGIFRLLELAEGNIGVMGAYNSLLMHASEEIRRGMSCEISRVKNKVKMSTMYSSYSMKRIPCDRKKSPYISKKNVENILNLNNKFEVGGRIISCSYLSLSFLLSSIDCYRSS
ncbi:ShET2/EspL2 family type III secretion system effector toxin, partial [Candidatus Ichthyocystis hellenicum]|uniref:ShET2/EspL2 family type III secretion system effector toxin n=1 Tax=Candidatus Ichthyocystis hellenicum TaxID=1561003 RepID=UPI000B88E871